MVSYCCIKGCKNSKRNFPRDPGVSFHGFPVWRKDNVRLSEVTRRRRMAWVTAIRRPDITFDKMPKTAKVCSLHFHKGKPNYWTESDLDWAPSLNLGYSVTPLAPPNRVLQPQSTCLEQITPPFEAVVIGENMEWNKQVVECASCVQKHTEIQRLLVELQALKSYQVNECYLYKCRHNEINHLLEENHLLRSNLENSKMEESFILGDNEKVRYYTGLPDSDTFEALLNTVAPHLPQNINSWSPYQMFLFTFTHLRLNLPLKYLIYQFQTTRSRALMAITHTISVLHAQFSHAVQWPCRRAMKFDLTGFFESSGVHVAVMVDIFGITTLHGTTVKYMISASPRSKITFISEAFESNAEDEEIIEQTGILEGLLPGDLVLADRFYELQENNGRKCLKVLPKNAAEVKKITNPRLAVKKAVLNIRRFAFLTGPVPHIMLRSSEGEEEKLLDKIVKVCCAITNIWPPKPTEKTNTE